MIKSLILSFFVVAIFSCGYFSSKKYGLKFNEERRKLGLPILCESWESTVVTLTNGGYKWINPERNKLINKYFSEKSMVILKDTLIGEYNYIVGEEKYNGLDVDFYERITISYIFKSQDDENTGLQYTYTTGEEYDQEELLGVYHPIEKDVTKEEADSLLYLWGIDLNDCD